MGRLGVGFLSRLFGRSSGGSVDHGIYVYARCSACGELIRSRINPTAELSPAEDESGEYFVRKVLIGQRCYRPVELALRFKDTRGTLASHQAQGGTFVDRATGDAEWRAASA